MTKSYTPRGLAVPSGRFTRAARMGSMTTQILGAMASDGARSLLRGEIPDRRGLLATPGNARRLTEELARMRGAAMKMGQLLSMEAGDFLPPELADILAHLRADAHFMPPKQLKSVLEAQYGRDFLTRFAKFDTRPIAAASIGQVHRARAKDGRDLALKIQYPGVRDAIDADVANLGTLLRLSGLLPKGVDLAPLLAEARRQLHEEADYTREAQELTRFNALIGDTPGLTLPRVHKDYCAPDILAMDFIESAPIDTVQTADQDTRDSVATRLVRLFLRELFDWQQVQTDPNFANYRWQPATATVVLLDFGASRAVPPDFAQACRGLGRAILAQDTDAMLAQLQAMGVLPDPLPDSQARVIREMIGIAVPMVQAEMVDFGDTRLLSAMRQKGMQLGLEEEFRHIPPWDAVYLQRKLGGMVLLATRLEARVPLRALLAAHL